MDGVTITISTAALVAIGVKVIDIVLTRRNGYVRSEECNRITTRIYEKLDTIGDDITETKVTVAEIKGKLE